MASLAEINIGFKANLAQFSKQMENVNRDLKKIGGQMQAVGKKMSLSLTLPIAAIGTMAYNMAADFEDALGATDQIFKKSSEATKQWADGLPTYFGIAKKEALEYSNMMGSMLVNIGNLTEKEASEQSAKLIELAGDLTAMYGGRTQDAVRALTGALKGNNTMLDNYGMAINDSLIKTKAMELGLMKQGEQLTLSAKQAATLALIYEQTGAAQGQAAREADGASGSIRALKTEFTNLTTEIGQVLLPVITPMIQKIRDAIASFREMSPETQKIIVVIGGVVAAIGPLIAIIGTVLTAIPAMTAGIASLGTAFTVLTGPIGLVVAAIGALIAVIAYNWDEIKQVIIDLANYFIDLYNESDLVRASVESIISVFKNLYEAGKYVINILGNGFRALWENIKTGFSAIGKVIKAVLTGNFSDIGQIVSDAFLRIGAAGKDLIDETKKDFEVFKTAVKSNVDDAINNVMKRRKLELIAPDTKKVKEKVRTDVSDSTEDGLNNGVVKFSKKGAKVKITPEIGSVGYYDEIIKKLREAQNIESTDSETFQKFETQIKAYEDLKNAITEKQAVENSEKWFTERISQMEEELKGLDMTSQAYSDLKIKIADYKSEMNSIQNPDIEPETGTVDWYDYHIAKLKEQMQAVGITTEAYAKLRQELEILENSKEIELRLNTEEITEKINETTGMFETLSNGIQDVFGSISQSLVNGLGEAESGFERFTQSLMSNVLKVISSALSGALANAILGATQTGVSTGPAAAFTTPTFIGSMTGAVLSAFAAIPKFADGGIVSGPTLGLMGEYPGVSSNPEVIAPLSKLKDLIMPAYEANSGDVHLTGDFRINGNDLVLAVDRTMSRKKRLF